MNQEIELRRLRVLDDNRAVSDLVLTNFGVNQRQDRGILGYRETMIPHGAVTTVRIEWKRSQWLLVLGLFLSVLGALSVLMDVRPLIQVLLGGAERLMWIQYGLFLGGIGMVLLFWFRKSRNIEIMAPAATIGGRLENYDDGVKFSNRVLSS